MYFETKQNQKPNKSKKKKKKNKNNSFHTHMKICCKHKTNAGLFVIYKKNAQYYFYLLSPKYEFKV